VYEDVARDTNRGHTVQATCESFHMSKDAGFKVVSHMMPDLPNVGVERDMEQFHEYFENPAFRSDGLKIYPTLVIRGTGLYELWRTGRYKNYTPNALVDIVARIMALIPPWTRIYRVQRDIPMPLVSSGVENGNLRELALQRMRDFGLACRDIRNREVGLHEIHHKVRVSQGRSDSAHPPPLELTRSLVTPRSLTSSNLSGAITSLTAGGRRSCRTRTRSGISSSASFACASAPRRAHSGRSSSRTARARWSASCTSTAPRYRCTPGTRPCSSTRESGPS